MLKGTILKSLILLSSRMMELIFPLGHKSIQWVFKIFVLSLLSIFKFTSSFEQQELQSSQIIIVFKFNIPLIEKLNAYELYALSFCFVNSV